MAEQNQIPENLPIGGSDVPSVKIQAPREGLEGLREMLSSVFSKGDKAARATLGPAAGPVEGLLSLVDLRGIPDALSSAGKDLKSGVIEGDPKAMLAGVLGTALVAAEGMPGGRAASGVAKSLRSLPKVDEKVTANKAFNITPEEKEIWREENLKLTKEKVAKELGITDPKEIKKINVKDRHRNPELEEITRDFDEGKITQEEFLKLRDNIKPLKQYGTVPELRSLEDVFLSMRQGKGKDLSIIGVNKNIEPNTIVESRFDIDAYSKYDNYVASIKDKSGMSYTNAVYLKDVDFVFKPDKAFNIAKGKPKSPFATIKGRWQNTEPEDVKKLAEEKINSGEWTEVGFDPASRTGFYDRSKKGGGRLLKSAEEILQVGPMILAKNVKAFSPKELENFKIKLKTDEEVLPFKKGGSVVERNPYNYTARAI